MCEYCECDNYDPEPLQREGYDTNVFVFGRELQVETDGFTVARADIDFCPKCGREL